MIALALLAIAALNCAIFAVAVLAGRRVERERRTREAAARTRRRLRGYLWGAPTATLRKDADQADSVIVDFGPNIRAMDAFCEAMKQAEEATAETDRRLRGFFLTTTTTATPPKNGRWQS